MRGRRGESGEDVERRAGSSTVKSWQRFPGNKSKAAGREVVVAQNLCRDGADLGTQQEWRKRGKERRGAGKGLTREEITQNRICFVLISLPSHPR